MTNRACRLDVSTRMLHTLLQLSPDVAVTGAWWDHERNGLAMRLEGGDLPEVEWGTLLQQATLMVETKSVVVGTKLVT